MPLFKKKAVEAGEAPAPRGYYRGPLPLPGREPVGLSSYRGAALRASRIKHRDQARDKYVLARNRRAQVLAGTVTPQIAYPEAIPALPAPIYAAPEVYSGAVVPYAEPAYVDAGAYGFPTDQFVYPQAAPFAAAAPSFGYVDASAGFFGGVPSVPAYSYPTTGFVGY